MELNNTRIVLSDAWAVRALLTKDDCFTFGAKRGWCTANSSGKSSFDEDYGRDKGDLFLLYPNDRTKPSHQIFFSKTGEVELRAVQNKFVYHADFFQTQPRELRDWYEARRYEADYDGPLGMATLKPDGKGVDY